MRKTETQQLAQATLDWLAEIMPSVLDAETHEQCTPEQNCHVCELRSIAKPFEIVSHNFRGKNRLAVVRNGRDYSVLHYSPRCKNPANTKNAFWTPCTNLDDAQCYVAALINPENR